jgi:hypothetical protein
MKWQCPRDGSMNTGWQCGVCGGPPFVRFLLLRGSDQVFQVMERSRIIGSGDWPSAGGMGLSRDHIRCFFSIPDGTWCVASVSRGGQTWLNGLLLEPGKRHAIGSGDSVQLGSQVFLTVELHDFIARECHG